ncbi:MAG: DUF2283 domain-containing protein [Candidatus Levybacteria bacterium]|nr:DUF2283 domain-containing protein [Candidatus Levybacteria bacterium]
MKYDKKENAVWIELAKGKYDHTRKISDAVLVDEDTNGKILGIEILDATQNIEAFDPEKINISVQSS